jgi:hypothetical protein
VAQDDARVRAGAPAGPTCVTNVSQSEPEFTTSTARPRTVTRFGMNIARWHLTRQ